MASCCKTILKSVTSAAELPGANTQAATLEEARESLTEAVELVLEANRCMVEETLRGKDVIREALIVAAK